MMRMVKAAGAASQYDKTGKVSYQGKRYSVHYTGGEEFGDPWAMFNSFKAAVSLIAPYDMAEYAWAQIANGRIEIIRNGKVLKKGFYFNAEDADLEDEEWADEVIRNACQMLEEANKDVQRMIDRT